MANEMNNNHKIEALTRAVILSPQINKVTIGPNSEVLLNNAKYNSIKTTKNSPIKTISVTIKNMDKEKRIVKLTDCSTIASKLLLKNIEKERLEKVKLEINERNQRFNEIDKKRYENYQKNLQTNLINSSKRLNKIEQNIIENIELDDKEYNLIKINEKLENDKRIIEKKQQIKEEEERIKQILLYRQMYENYREQFLQSYNNIFQLINNYNEKNIPNEIQLIIKQYKELYNRIIKLPITNDYKQIEKCSIDMIEFTKQFKEIWQPIIEKNEYNDTIEKEKQEKLYNDNLQKQREKEIELEKIENIKKIEKENYDRQKEQQNNQLLTNNNELYEKYEKLIEPLINDESMKIYCRDIKRGIFLTTNRISSNASNEHLLDIYMKLIGILSLDVVQINNFKVTAGIHPLGQYFALLTIAKRFVELGEICQTNGYFSLASVLVSIWAKFPEIGEIFLLQLYQKCPFLNPNFIAPLRSTINYHKLIGYKNVDNIIEDESLYLERMAKYTKFYGAITMTKLQSNDNLHNLDNGWKILTCFINRNDDECLYINSRLLVEFLDFTGLQMLNVYGKQFIKIIKILENFYIKKLNGLPKDKLETFINFIKEGKLPYPSGFNKKYL